MSQWRCKPKIFLVSNSLLHGIHQSQNQINGNVLSQFHRLAWVLLVGMEIFCSVLFLVHEVIIINSYSISVS